VQVCANIIMSRPRTVKDVVEFLLTEFYSYDCGSEYGPEAIFGLSNSTQIRISGPIIGKEKRARFGDVSSFSDVNRVRVQGCGIVNLNLDDPASELLRYLPTIVGGLIEDVWERGDALREAQRKFNTSQDCVRTLRNILQR